jgi:FkbM family methyltransferase
MIHERRDTMESLLYRRTKQKGFQPRHVVEVGVYLPETSNVYHFILAGIRCTLVEPDPDTVSKIREHCAGRKNVSLHAVAVFDKHGTLELVKRGASTYVAEIEGSPAVINDQYRLQDTDRFSVDAVTFDEIDDGSIDLLSVDIEGGEWFVIKHMVSRPAVISLETHAGLYRNPHMVEIAAWMRDNQYLRWYLSDSDSVYVRSGVFRVTPFEKLRLVVADAGLWLEKTRKRVKRMLRRRRS